MKIIIFKESILGSSERFVLDQALQIKKFDVILIGLKKLKSIDLSSIKTICVDYYSKLQIITYKLFGFCPVLVSIIKKINPQLIHIHMGCDAARFSLIRNKFKTPVIVTFHGTDATTSDEWKKSSKFLYYKQYLKQRQRLIKSTNHFIAISEFVKRCLIKQGYPEKKITVHYMGIDTQFFTPNNEKRKPVVLFVGRLTEVKGCHYLIQAMSEVKKVTNAELVIIGDGPELEKLKKMSIELGVYASFLGALKRESIKSYLSKASVFCAPSTSLLSGQAEGLGLVFLEAQAMGTPVVSFSSGGISEAVRHNVTGLLYPEKDVQGLSEGIMKLLTDHTTWDKFSKNGIQHIHENFDIVKQTRKLEEIYLQTIKEQESKHK